MDDRDFWGIMAILGLLGGFAIATSHVLARHDIEIAALQAMLVSREPMTERDFDE